MAPTSFPPPPPGLNYVAAIEPSLIILLIDVTFSTFLVPTLIVMFYFSTRTTRRKPVFIMNVISIVLALALAAINTYNQSSSILAKPVNPMSDTASACMLNLAPWFAEFILVVRVLAVYPPRLMSWSSRIFVYAPIAVFKTARIANLIDFLVAWGQLTKHAFNPLVTSQEAWELPNAKIEWILQFCDMFFVSALFLARLRQGARMKREAGLSHSSSITSTGTHTTFSSRVRTLCWIAASNLVFPVLLDFIQLVYIFHDNSFVHCTYVLFVNVHVQIIGVLLATMWSTAGTTQRERDSEGVLVTSEVQFAGHQMGSPGLATFRPQSVQSSQTMGSESNGRVSMADTSVEGETCAKEAKLTGITEGHPSREFTLGTLA
ncbi:hypothetical protein GY45DRAFT_1375242 [Cubamyces sp. BRFM 1775]|nr:hypothetical protein GY45DRAFT_1375242 [Cubamyces sp. BRFM 1775]